MRILQLHNHQSSSGGALHVMQHEAELLRSAGHSVEQLLEPAAEDSGMNAVAMGVSAVWNRKACRALDRRIDTFKPDVVHVHTPFPLQSPAVFRVAHARGCATVGTLHAYRYSCVGGLCFRDGKPCQDCVGSTLKLAGVRHRCYHDSVAGSAALTVSIVGHRAIGTFTNRVDRFLTLTDFGRDLLIRDGFPAEKIMVKPNAVPDPGPPLPFAERGGYALHVGRLTPEKGIESLLEAWRSVDKGRELYIAGDGPLRDLVDASAAADPRIHALGWCDSATLTDLHARASLVITPSRWYEAGPPLVVLESLASGTPQLTSDLRNISESLVEHGAGTTFTSGDSSALAAAVNAVFADDSARETMGTRARQLYEAQHTPERNLQALEDVYESVVQGRRARGRVRSSSQGGQ